MHCVPKVNKEYGDICLLRQEEFKKAGPKRELVLRGQVFLFFVKKKVYCGNKCVGGQGIVPKPPEHI